MKRYLKPSINKKYYKYYVTLKHPQGTRFGNTAVENKTFQGNLVGHTCVKADGKAENLCVEEQTATG